MVGTCLLSPGVVLSHNLGQGGASTRQMEWVVRRVRPADTVLLLFTTRELVFSRDETLQKPAPLNTLHVRAIASKSFARFRLGIERPLTKPARKAARARWSARTIREHENIGTIDTAFFSTLYETHPNIVFVFSPTKPEVLSITHMELLLIKSIITELRVAMLRSGLPFLDLSNLIDDPALFVDHIHPKPKGCEMVRQRLIHIL